VAPATQTSVVHTSSIHVLSTCDVPDAQSARAVSPDTAYARHPHQAAWRHPTALPPSLRSATCNAKKSAGGHAQIAENELLEPTVIGRLQEINSLEPCDEGRRRCADSQQR